jgi:hypothetical protein
VRDGKKRQLTGRELAAITTPGLPIRKVVRRDGDQNSPCRPPAREHHDAATI